MMSTDERLGYMADQIARNFAVLGVERAVLATADHIATFWDPRMKARAFAILESERPEWMTDLAARSFERLRDRGSPDAQSGATTFSTATGTSLADAG